MGFNACKEHKDFYDECLICTISRQRKTIEELSKIVEIVANNDSDMIGPLSTSVLVSMCKLVLERAGS